MKHLSVDEIVGQVTPVRTLTRKERLSRWAELVWKCDHSVQLYHNLEHYDRRYLEEIRVTGTNTAFAIATADPVLVNDGLPSNANVPDIMRYFGLTQSQLHEFSCDCGGFMSNEQQAQRIASLA